MMKKAQLRLLAFSLALSLALALSPAFMITASATACNCDETGCDHDPGECGGSPVCAECGKCGDCGTPIHKECGFCSSCCTCGPSEPSPRPSPSPSPGNRYTNIRTPKPEQAFSPGPMMKLSVGDLDKMLKDAADGVITITVPGSPETLQFDLPLSWFMENLGVTLVVFADGLGLLAVSSENMIELAALAYEGEGGVTMVINGKELTFRPDTIVSYIMKKGSVVLSVTTNGQPLDWYVYDSPVILCAPGAEEAAGAENTGLLVAAEARPDGSERIIPRSLFRDDGKLIYAMVNREGEYRAKYNRKSFQDVAGGWMEDAVLFMAARDVVKGAGDDLFEPERPVTRAEYVTMLARMMDYDTRAEVWMPFDDVPGDAYYYESVRISAALRILPETWIGSFEGNQPIAREEMFALTCNALMKFYLLPVDGAGAGADALEQFSDAAEISDYAVTQMGELARHELIAGSDGRINPQGVTTRAEAAQFLTNIIKFIVPDYSGLIQKK